ncbi:MAG: PHP domain-containing protein [Lentisphaerae bacterium]|jgi:3',5'-nucleoside bisphosphate phosphatase|nr:PHP domain-containing protein [Lentisphaerota bacterium]MBT4815882.1 PHP domain-containing protein [Lentisphaerota bacterium]MBT5609071.1 PHP domain-containing protein [Lentisphaerota bacterium]MBT7053834.1 PHP domain-containing protein [Lentisphaerota bacterium]MBT7842469.1 PHP domain-containing protein [Lentisphaerota bacterium]
MPNATYDLHLHTHWSYDATASVAYYFRCAQRLNLRCIAITEHHTVDSLPEVLELAPKKPEVAVIPSAELSVTTSGGAAIDMVCLGLPVTPVGELRTVLDLYHQWQCDYGASVSAGLQALGYDYSDKRRLELLETYRPRKTIDVQGITHVQNGIQRKYFVAEGFMESEDGYGPLLRRAAEHVPQPPYPAAARVIPAVQNAGGLAIIAHPTGYFARNDRRRMDALREELGFDGIECAHTSIPHDLTPVYRAYCEEHGLLSSAGSDCHADPADNPYGIAPQNALGQHIGEDVWLDELLERVNPLPNAPAT